MPHNKGSSDAKSVARDVWDGIWEETLDILQHFTEWETSRDDQVLYFESVYEEIESLHSTKSNSDLSGYLIFQTFYSEENTGAW